MLFGAFCACKSYHKKKKKMFKTVLITSFILLLLLGTLGASLLENSLVGRAMNRAGEGAIAKRQGRGVIRAGNGAATIKQGKGIVRAGHENKTDFFNDVYSRDNLPKKRMGHM